MKYQAGRNWAQESPYEPFFDFIAPQADRFGILLEHIQNLSLNSMTVGIEGSRHFFIFPRDVNLKLTADTKFPYHGQKPVVLTAHYDRVPGSPGANDNSAAVFHLLKAAVSLGEHLPEKQGSSGRAGAASTAGKVINERWMIIFTDKEELQTGQKIQEQGSYSLAKKLKSWGLANARIFNFDACGAGDTFIFSTTTDYLINKNARPGLIKASRTVSELREKAYAAANNLHFDKVLSFPVPFSDDAGFLRGGIPAQTITMLPSDEAAALAHLLRSHPSFADAIIAGLKKNNTDRMLVPATWRYLNSKSDSHLRLTPENFDKVVRFAAELCRG